MELKIKIETQGALFSGKAPEIIQKQLDQAITSATMLLTAEVIKRTPQGVFGAQGGLLGSIKGEVVQKGTPVVKGIVCTASPYGEVMESGRRAGAKMPPGAVLSCGIRVMEKGQKVRKGEVAYARLSDRSRVAYHDVADGGLVRWIEVKFGVDTKKASELEFVVRRAIARHGIKGVHMFEEALNENMGKIEEIFNNAGFSIAKELSE